MKVTLLQTCRIGLLTTLLAASFPQDALAGLVGTRSRDPSEVDGNRLVFRLSTTPLQRSRGG